MKWDDNVNLSTITQVDQTSPNFPTSITELALFEANLRAFRVHISLVDNVNTYPQTPLYILLYAHPPKNFLQLSIHLCNTWMNRISQTMELYKQIWN